MADDFKVENENIEEVKNEIELKVKNSPEVQAIASQIDLKNVESILTFGKETAEEISKFADKILNSIETTKVEDSGTLLVQLNKIMDKFDIKDFNDAEKKQGLLKKLFKKAEKTIDGLLKKYHTMGGEVDKVYIQLKEYENEITQSNRMLEEMFNKNMEYYETLEKYIQAGHLAVERLKTEVLPQLEEKTKSGEQIDQVNYSNALQVLEMMEQRIYDLELAKSVALQTMPQIKLIQKGNYNLIRKINSAFIITIPIFKQSLNQAITLKRQKIQSQAMAALDEKTNELLLRNAQNTAMQSKMTAQLAGSSSIKLETLEETWKTIMKGIDETREIQETLKQERINGTKKLHELQNEYNNKIKNK